MLLTKEKNYLIESYLDAIECAVNNENAKGLKHWTTSNVVEGHELFKSIEGKIKPTKVKRFTPFKSDLENIEWQLKNIVAKKNQLRDRMEKLFFDFEQNQYVATNAMVLTTFVPQNTIHADVNLLFSLDLLSRVTFEVETTENKYPQYLFVLPDGSGSIDFCLDANLFGELLEVIRIAKLFDVYPTVKIYDTFFDARLLVKCIEFLMRSGGSFPLHFNQKSVSYVALCELENCRACIMPLVQTGSTLYFYQLV